MKRHVPLRRKVGLKRSRFRRSGPRPNKAGSNPAHLAWLREQPCCLCERPAPSHAHHITTGRGLSQKTPDDWAIPMCPYCHFDLHNFLGFFFDYTREERAEWQQTMSARYQPAAVSESA